MEYMYVYVIDMKVFGNYNVLNNYKKLKIIIPIIVVMLS